MPQKRILLEPERTYHIWTHANGSENLFRCDENYRYFMRRYRHYIHPVVETFAYCLMLESRMSVWKPDIARNSRLPRYLAEIQVISLK